MKKRLKFSNLERDCIHLICKDFSNEEIAELLGLERKSVENTTYRVFRKAGVSSRLGLVIFLLQKKYIKLNNCIYTERKK